jgi:hypothetical protein
MNVEIGAAAAQFPEKEYINGIAVAVWDEGDALLCPHLSLSTTGIWTVDRYFKTKKKNFPSTSDIVFALQRKSYLCIPFLGMARPQPQFPHSCVCEQLIYSQERSTYFLQQKRQTDCRKNINPTQTHECGNRDWDPDIPFLGIFVSKFRYFVFAVCFMDVKYGIGHLCPIKGCMAPG